MTAVPMSRKNVKLLALVVCSVGAILAFNLLYSLFGVCSLIALSIFSIAFARHRKAKHDRMEGMHV